MFRPQVKHKRKAHDPKRFNGVPEHERWLAKSTALHARILLAQLRGEAAPGSAQGDHPCSARARGRR